jgi:hypothetical protein
MGAAPLADWFHVLTPPPHVVLCVQVRTLIHNLLVRIGRHHPQALMYPLLVATKSQSPSRRQAAQAVLEMLRTHSATLVDQAQVRVGGEGGGELGVRPFSSTVKCVSQAHSSLPQLDLRPSCGRLGHAHVYRCCEARLRRWSSTAQHVHMNMLSVSLLLPAAC